MPVHPQVGPVRKPTLLFHSLSLPLPLLSSLYSLSLFCSSSSFLLLPSSLSSLSPPPPPPSSLLPSSPLPLFLYLLLRHTIHTVLGFQALSQCPWMFKTFAYSMRSHTESAGRLTGQGNLTEVCLSLSQNDMAAHVTTQRVLIRTTACILGPKYRPTCLQSSLGIVDGIG